METAGISFEEHLAISGFRYTPLSPVYCTLIFSIVLGLIIATFLLFKKRKNIKQSSFILLLISIIAPIIILVYASFIPYFGYETIERTFWQEAQIEFDSWWFQNFSTPEQRQMRDYIDARR